MDSSLEPPPSAFGGQARNKTVPVTQLSHLLGMARSDRPPMLQSGFSSAFRPLLHGTLEAPR